jgi:predicted GNAT superfamily acetyltransferase
VVIMPGPVTTVERAAAEQAEQAAHAAGVEIRLLDDVADLVEAERLLAGIWGDDGQDVMSVHLMKALAHTHNYVAGAFPIRGGNMVAASAAFAWGQPGRRALHSHVTGVRADTQARGVGYATKLHQRAWSLLHEITEITWTFDPLIRRNAWFNVAKLGVRVGAYHADFYGPMHDGVNAGDESDRCLVVWDLRHDLPTTPGLTRQDVASAVALLVEERGSQPAITEAGQEPDRWAGARLSCQIPADAVALRAADPPLGRQWRQALRATMGRAIESGHPVAGITADGRYVLGAARP